MYILMCRDKEILHFNYDNVNIQDIHVINEYNLGTYTLATFIDSRKVLIKRNQVAEQLKQAVDKFDLLVQLTHCISLNDTLWIKHENDIIKWKDVSPYNNTASRTVSEAILNFTDVTLGSQPIPEMSTSGSFPKCWIYDDTIYLLKRNECSNEGLELNKYNVYCEILTAQLAEALDIEHISYTLLKYQEHIVTRCELFTSESMGFVTVNQLSYLRDIRDVIQWLLHAELPYTQNIRKLIIDMLMLDFLSLNVDRHTGNMGFYTSTLTGNPIRFAKLFDHNLSQLYDYTDTVTIDKYLNIKLQNVNLQRIKYLLENILTVKDKDYILSKLTKLSVFSYQNPMYGCPDNWVSACNYVLGKRIKDLKMLL